MIERLRVRIMAEMAGKFSSPELTLCADSYLVPIPPPVLPHHHHHLSLNCKGHLGTTGDFASSFLHFSLFSTAFWDLVNCRPVHSMMLSSHVFLCLPCLLPPFTVPCKMVLTILLQFVSPYDGQEAFVWSDCLLNLCTDILIGNMVFV